MDFKINNSKDYINLAIKTENKDTAAIAERLIKDPEVLKVLNETILICQKLDAVVKKKAFYGKEPKEVNPPLFPETLNKDQKNKMSSTQIVRLIHGFMGVVTEGGEGLEAIAKSIRDLSELDTVNVGEENGDIDWYQAVIADECKTDFEKEQEKNIKKLAKRHGDKFSSVKVMDRDLEAERKILENK